MMQFGQLPEWMDMGDDEERDFVTPSISLAEQLKKKIGKPKAGGLGGAMGGVMDFGGSAPALSAMSAAKGGPKSL